MNRICRYIPAALCAGLFMAGCYTQHGDECDDRLPTAQVCCDGAGNVAPPASTCPFACARGAPVASEDECMVPLPPPPLVDAGPVTPDTAPPPRDAAPPPPPPECPAVRADSSCLESFQVEPGVPFELPVTFDTCGCCAETACAAEVDAASQTLSLTTALCPDPCDCAECNTPRAACAIPPLAEGTWSVLVNGAPAFTLPVHRATGLPAPPAACVTYAEPDSCPALDGIVPRAWSPSRVCVEERLGALAPTDVTITVAPDCWSCLDHIGPCEVTLEERHTFDLPPGGELRVSPTIHRSGLCITRCGPGCWERAQRCQAPALTPGDFYRVWIDGEVALSFTAGEADGICAGSTP